MGETIRVLKARIEELELLLPPDPSTIYLKQPYLTPVSSRTPRVAELNTHSMSEASHSFGLPEPPSHLIANLAEVFTERFAESALFFLNPIALHQSVLRPGPFGDPDRPCPALLCAIYLWGSALVDTPSTPYTPEAFLMCCLQNIAQDVHDMVGRPKFTLETLQAEVLLSLYYMHAAQPIPGRYHSSAAVSIALGAGLHLTGSARKSEPHCSPFSVPASWAWGGSEAGTRIDAFWAVVILNNYWVVVDGAPSSISYEMSMDTPWSSMSQSLGDATIMKFLDGDDSEGSSPPALLAKATILLERVIAVSTLNTDGTRNPSAQARADARLDRFHATLPPGPSPRSLMLAHALTDTAIIRLHAPYAPIAASSRAKCLAGAERIVTNLTRGQLIPQVDAILGAVYMTACRFYTQEMAVLCDRLVSDLNAQLEYCALDAKLSELFGTVRVLASSSPISERYFIQMQQEYGCLPRFELNRHS
ncbi:hypothetical protein FB451DRAFT_1406096 [Mycena latifolia]|nr:hypothetical protein FB451DRAFT_1406096 [Mycena latifolia]